jgi:hypothetical protein
MPTTITHTIGTGGDYTAHSTWEAAKPADLTVADEVWEGQTLNQAFTTGTGPLVQIDGSVTDATRFTRLTTAPNASFRDNASVRTTNALRFNSSNGASISCSDNYGTGAIGLSEAYAQLTKLQIAQTVSNFGAVSHGGGHGLIEHCILEAKSTVIGGDQYTARNCVIVKRATGGTIASGSANAAFYNCTIVCIVGTASQGVHIGYPSGTSILENTAILGATTALSNSGSTTITTCATDQTSPPAGFTHVTFDTSLLTNITDGSHDLRLPLGSALIDVATADSSNAATDISGTARPQGSAYDIGAWEYAAPPPPTPPVLYRPAVWFVNEELVLV